MPHARPTDRHQQGKHLAIWALLIGLLATTVLLILPPLASANFVYWANPTNPGSIGRAKLNGAGANNNFITGLNQPSEVAVDPKYIYWSEGGANRIGRANLMAPVRTPTSSPPESPAPWGLRSQPTPGSIG